jgi:hypothetical protein
MIADVKGDPPDGESKLYVTSNSRISGREGCHGRAISVFKRSDLSEHSIAYSHNKYEVDFV